MERHPLEMLLKNVTFMLYSLSVEYIGNVFEILHLTHWGNYLPKLDGVTFLLRD